MRQLKITKSITNRESASLDKYLQEIGKEELISVEEEVELAQRIRRGDQEALEKLISLHIVDLETKNGTHYQLHKIKAIEAAITFRLIESLIHNEAGFACGDFLALIQN